MVDRYRRIFSFLHTLRFETFILLLIFCLDEMSHRARMPIYRLIVIIFDPGKSLFSNIFFFSPSLSFSRFSERGTHSRRGNARNDENPASHLI